MRQQVQLGGMTASRHSSRWPGILERPIWSRQQTFRCYGTQRESGLSEDAVEPISRDLV